MSKNEITIDGIEYIRKDLIKPVPVINNDGLEYVLIRTYSAGVWVGFLNGEIKDQIATLLNARNIWYWEGAASLSQLANDGVSKPENCKFPMEVSKVTLFQVVQILPVSETAKESISKVEVWKS